MKLDAVIFDFDGVITDTEYLHFQAFLDLVRAEGIVFTWEDYQQRYIGFDDRDALQAIFADVGRGLDVKRQAAMIEAKAEIFLRQAADPELKPFPGVMELVESLQAAGVPLAICSGALASDIDPLLARFGLEEAFPLRVTAEDVPRSKPDPACYRLSRERLGVAGAEHTVLAIEDTPTGMAAARGAGCRVLGVTHTCPEAELLESACRVVSSLEQIDVDGLCAWLSDTP